ncbi:CHAP domain-containing protein [Pedobacter sp. HMF7647]|uniref:CHAP domain-containing protein n=1 Tax=Hufsiella arboris TaxID=2695275 RepID=A0A7K1YEM3_9SPHI|nr:CHAP domain-containing protein [Hufsiella arboris]MXV52468.1 CHAP domain-containing protein [Hufsiella arboris]
MDYPNRVIKEGETDQNIVIAIQQRLDELGLGPFQFSGTFGPKTKAAVKLFQSTHRDKNGVPLEMDGEIGAITWSVLFDKSPVVVSENPPNNLLAEAIKVAKTQVGTMEEPPGSNKGVQVNKYLASVDCPPGSFWCAGFVYWCFNEAAKSLGVANPLFKTGGCLDHWNNTNGRRIKALDAANNPSLIQAGSIFIINHGEGKGHTGIVVKEDGGFIHTIEGNSNPSGSSNGIGVFELQRKIIKINAGFILYE